MSPITLAFNTVNRAVASFHPGSMPVLSRGHYRRELVAWLFLPAMLGAVEGGVAGVLAKNAFEGHVSSGLLNLAVALLAGAPAFSNVLSFVWAAVSNGRHKIRFLVGLQIATAVAVSLIALAPLGPAGLILITACVITARLCWSGVLTIRSTVWRANYPRSDRATMAGKLATLQAVMLTAVGLIIGLAMRWDESAFRLVYPVAGGLGLVGALVYRKLRVRGHRALLRDERLDATSPLELANPASLYRVLRGDRRFRRYMTCMFIFGSGNLMVTTPLVIMLRDRFRLEELSSILIASSIPALLMPLSIPWWSRLLDRVHIISFRAVHCWAFVAATSLFLAGALLDRPVLLVLGAVAKGIAIGGGVLGWNLGHLDFAPPRLANRYMGVHVTLTGVRGLLAPLFAVGLYELLEEQSPGAGAWVLAVSLTLTLLGAAGFVVMAREQPAMA